MSLHPTQTIHKALLSTPSNFVGEYSHELLLISHAWRGSDRGRSRQKGTGDRNGVMLVFEMNKLQEAPGVAIPDYSQMATVIASYLSVLFGKRFDSHGLVETHGWFLLPNLEQLASPVSTSLPHNSQNVRVDFPVPLNLGEVVRLFPLLFQPSLTPAFVDAFRAGAKFYAQALQMVEQDPEVAYLHLVTTIEILSSQTEFQAADLYDDATQEYFAKLELELTNGLEIVKHFRKHMMAVKRRYVQTILNLVDRSFFTRSECDKPFGQLTEESFQKCIAASYDLRSHYVHSGRPFGSWILRGFAGTNQEVMIGQPIVEGKEFAKTLARAPTFVGLERIVRYCLLKSALLRGLYIDSPTGESLVS